MLLYGNDYLGWFETAIAGTFAALKGQGTFSETRSQPEIDGSDKTSQGYSTGSFGLTKWSGDLDVRVNLPDAVYTRIEALSIARTPVMFQLRKGGEAGALADAVFAAKVNLTIKSRSFAKDGTVDVKIGLMLAAAPTIDTLA